jgi:hypothetical protein
VPLPEWDTSSPSDHNAAFADDGENDVERCPRGQVLKLEWIDEAGGRAVYRARRQLQRLSGEARVHAE